MRADLAVHIVGTEGQTGKCTWKIEFMERFSKGSEGWLARVTTPDDLKHLPLTALPELAQEVREFIVQGVATNPGHLGASLGVVELTIALLYAYTPPQDKVVWDVGHQAYVYKILTGRRGAFSTNRRFGGLCGFPLPAESPYDAFAVGHSSTSVSAALGIAEAKRQLGEPGKVVAVIGDGAMTGGMAFEALNNAGAMRNDLLVVLNDNDMSIDPNVGSLREYLLDIATWPKYNRLKEFVWCALGRSGRGKAIVQRIAQQIDRAIKGAILARSNWFEAMGFRYFGPIDGHDVEYLAQVLCDLRKIDGPKLLHCVTVKGKGYAPAEREKTVWHAPGRFDAATGVRNGDSAASETRPKYQDVFARTLIDIARANRKVVGITPAMPTGTSLLAVMHEFPQRTYDVGIAEQHAVTFAAGMASQGMLPFCAIYSTFMQRAYDQLVHDVALQNLHCVFCLDRAGLVGEDGATHHGVFDLAYLRGIPNFTVCAPMDEYEMEAMMRLAALSCGPWAIRYPRGAGQGPDARHDVTSLLRGKGRRLAEGSDAVILSLGTVGNNATRARELLQAEGYSVGHYDLRFLKPLDTALLDEVASRYGRIYTVEDGIRAGGFGSAVTDYLIEQGYKGCIHCFGVPDRFVSHGTIAQLQAQCGYGAEQLAHTIAQQLAKS